MRLKTLFCTALLILGSAAATFGMAGEITWIDVRSADEFNAQHVAGAINIPYEKIGTDIALLDLEKDSVIYLYCKSGRRAGLARETLAALGYTQVTNIGGLETALVEAEKTTPQ